MTPLERAARAARQALEPFAEVADWAERNGHDLAADFDMLLRGPGTQIAGHLAAQAEDFIQAQNVVAMIDAALAEGE